MKRAESSISRSRRSASEDRVNLYVGFRSFVPTSSKSSKPRRQTTSITDSEAAGLIFHLDIDCFFAQVEQIDHPELRGKPVTADRLHRFGIRTLADAADLSRHDLISSLGTLGLFVWERARGRDLSRSELSADDAIDEVQRDNDHLRFKHRNANDLGRKSISRETTFRKDIVDIEHLRSVLGHLCERACWALRREGLSAGSVSVKVRFADFSTLTRHCRPALYTDGELRFTDIDHELYIVAVGLLDEALARRYRQSRRPPLGTGESAEQSSILPRPVRLIGVRLSKLSACDQRQWRFGEPVRLARDRRLLKTADQIRDRYGFGSVALGRSINLIEKTRRSAIPKGTKNLPSFQRTEPSIGR